MSSLFSPNNHVRHSHYLQPNVDAAPLNSFGRSGGIKTSLKKIPSAIYQKEKTPIKKKLSKSRFHVFVDSSTRTTTMKESEQVRASQPLVTDNKLKTKTKPRKALADIFHWGNHSNNATPAQLPQISKPIIQPVKTVAQPLKPTAPTVPTKEPAMTFKKTIRPPSTKSTNSYLGSIRSPVFPPAAPRPSMSDDPFGRDGEGAEVVDHVFRIGAKSPSVKSSMLDRRDSIASSKAMSYKTNVQESPMAPLSNTSAPQAHLDHAQRSVSAPMPTHPVVTDLPLRSASLGKALGIASLQPPPIPEEPVMPEKTLQREKTKSKVWGFLGRSKSKKQASIEHQAEENTWDRPPIPVKPVASLSAYMDDKYASATLRSNVSTMRKASSRPRPPVLHVSAPSSDDPNIPVTGSSLHPSSADKIHFDTVDSDFHDAVSRFPGQGIWESVVGSAAERPSDTGQRQAIEALMGPSRLPKRKSLTGLFGVAIKKSMERIKPSSPPRAARAIVSRLHASPPRAAAMPTLRSLAEEREEAIVKPKKGSEEDLFARHFAPIAKFEQQEVLRSDAGLRRVASATDKLLNLVALGDFSPAMTNSPGGVNARASSNSLRQTFNGSPTPVRRVKSAMLSTKSSSPLKPSSANVSPLKLALHRAQAAAHVHMPQKKASNSPTGSPRQSMVRKGMRNIFAPPSPVPPKPGKPATSLTAASAAQVTDEYVGMGQTMGPTIIQDRTITNNKRSEASDVPADLKAIISDDEVTKGVCGSFDTTRLGLPPLPPQDRISPRCPAAAPPALSLPPVPDVGSPNHLFTPENSFADAEDHTDNLSLPPNDFRHSFDFTSEYAALDQGNQRASFVEALKRVGSAQQMFMDVSAPPVPSLPVPTEAVPSFHVSKPSDSTTVDDEYEDDEEEGDDDEILDETVEIHHVVGIAKTSPVRREPFKGQVAFQQHISTMRQVSHASFGAPEPVVCAQEQPAVACTRRKGHRRGQSSVATMSSIGSVIGTGNEREYTNYFEANFAARLAQAHSRQSSVAESIEKVIEDSVRHSFSQESMSEAVSQNARPTTRRGHHRRNSSIVSIDSMGGDVNIFGAFPPVSMHNNRRSSYISRHRRNGSADSTFGRPDWAAHRRNSSATSTSSSISVSRLGRPGLGDRMFQLDGGVVLTSITGSPPDESAPSSRSSMHNRNPSWNSLFDHSAKVEDSLFDTTRPDDSLFTSSNRTSTDSDSIFGPAHSTKKQFFLRGLRPVSTVSTAASSEHDDTFTHIARFSRKQVDVPTSVEKDIEQCLQGEGEDMSNITPLGKAKIQPITGRQMLGSSVSRPPKPGRRRPPQLVFAEPPLDTPGLTSPSASETSSRMSLDTNAASITFGMRTRPHGMGHQRQKSSAGVKVDFTIPEMPSMATLRASSPNVTRPVSMASHSTKREPTIVGVDTLEEEDNLDKMQTVRNWVQWEREAKDEFRKTRNEWVDSEESKHAIEEFKMPQTTQEIAAFLAQSSQSYRPLSQLPIGRQAHRRKSSLCDSRAITSPYGLPLPKPTSTSETENKPKMSLTTKFEKKNSSGASSTISMSMSSSPFAFAFPDDVPEPPSAAPMPISAVFAQFARETPPSPPPSIAPFKPLSPFHLPTLTADTFGLKKQLEESENRQKEKDEKRSRVTSSARRQALGWGRRRNSDGPEQTISIKGAGAQGKQSRPVVLANLAAASASTTSKSKDKENVLPPLPVYNGSSSGKDQENMNNFSQAKKMKAKSPVKRRGPRHAASQPRGLRA